MLKPLVLSLFMSSALAGLDAHSHGEINLKVMSEGKEVVFLLNTSAHDLVGFEHKPTTLMEKQIIKKVETHWKTSVFGMIKSLKGCKPYKSDWKHKFSGKHHSNFVAEAYIKCDKKVSKRKFKIDLKKDYPEIEHINIQILRSSGKGFSKSLSNKQHTLEL